MYNPQSGSRGGLYCGQHRDLGMLDSAEKEGWVGIGCNLGLPFASFWCGPYRPFGYIGLPLTGTTIRTQDMTLAAALCTG